MAQTSSRPPARTATDDRREQVERRLSPKVRTMLRARELTPDQVTGTGVRGRIVPADVAAIESGPDTHARSAPTTRPRGHSRQPAVASPLVRRLLRDAGLTITAVAGTGPRGRVTRDDARRAITSSADGTEQQPATASAPRGVAPAAAPDAGASTEGSGTVALTPTRRNIAERMHRSLQTSAQLTAAVEVDLTRLMTHLRRAQPAFEQRTGLALSPFPLIASAVCAVLARHPELNARIDTTAGTATYVRDVHLGIAVDTDGGLVVPTVRSAQELSITGLTQRIAELAARARNHDLRSDDVTEGTFTMANPGSRGVLFDTPILSPPQVATLSTALIEKRPVVATDEFGSEALAIRQMSYLCLTYDHQLVDGADAARFLADLEQHLDTAAPLAEFIT